MLILFQAIVELVLLKRLKFSHEKCKLLKINSSDQQYSLQVNGQEMEVKDPFRYLGYILSSKSNNMAMTGERIKRSVGSTIKLISLCKEVQFGDSQINNMLLLYQLIFLPCFIYNCEAGPIFLRMITSSCRMHNLLS